MTTRTVLVLGGGIGGVSAARALRRRLAPIDRVVLVERNPVFRFAPSFLWVMNGSRQAGQVTADVRGPSPPWHRGRRGLSGGHRSAAPAGGDLGGGSRLRPPGRRARGRARPRGPPRLRRGCPQPLHARRSRVGQTGRSPPSSAAGSAVLVSRLPYKCPAAPYEAAFLAEALLRRRGVHPDVAIDVYTPEPLPMPTAGEDVGWAVAGMLKARGIGFQPSQAIERIEEPARRLVFADGAQADYDVLIGVPPHRAPAALAGSELAGPSGFVPADRHSLATALEGIHAIGDATQIPLAEGRFMLRAAGSDPARCGARPTATGPQG